MKYYCKNCGSEFKPGFESYLEAGGLSYPKEELEDTLIFTDKCPYCEFELETIPDYETPEQYEQRTGKAFPEKGAVYDLYNGFWVLTEWSSPKKAEQRGEDIEAVVIADPPVPPPDDWRPEVKNV